MTIKIRRREFMPRGIPPSDLSPRQLQILQLLAEGLTNREIAMRLGCKENTAKKHTIHVFDRTGMSTRVEAVIWFYQRQINEKDDYIRQLEYMVRGRQEL
jgi:DNA-binding NarL/FixJ family response regulator